MKWSLTDILQTYVCNLGTGYIILLFELMLAFTHYQQQIQTLIWVWYKLSELLIWNKWFLNVSKLHKVLPDWWLLQVSLPPNFLFLSPSASFVSLKASWSCNKIQYTVTPALFSPESMNMLNCKCCDPKYLWLRFANVWYITILCTKEKSFP